MSVVVRGTVRSRALDLSDPLPLPEGTEVIVTIEPLPSKEPQALSDEDFLTLPFFGMWADREEMEDSVAWVRKMREAWQEQVQSPD